MARPIFLPELNAGMEEATVLRWIKNPGDPVALGDPIAEIETEKVTIELEATDAGFLGEPLIAAGSTGVSVNTILAYILEEGEELTATASAPATQNPAKEPLDTSRTSEPPSAPSLLTPHTEQTRTIARRMTQSKSLIPHFYLTVDFVLDALLEARAEFNRTAGVHITITDCLVRATADALAAIPEMNSSWKDEGMARNQDADVAVAVATENGLVTPIVRRANQKSMVEIATECRALAERARTGRLRRDEFDGGGFTITNLGMYGIREFAAIINPPQSGILAVGAAERRPLVREDQVAIGTALTCTLSVDHRVANGVTAASFLGRIRALIESPGNWLGA